MKNRSRIWLSGFLVLLAAGETLGAEALDLNTQLMLATFKVSNPASTGTAFILSRPRPDDPKKPRFVLITAEHVLRLMIGDEATLTGRKTEADGGFSKLPVKFKVRLDGKPVWTKHPQADLAVMEFSPPEGLVIPEIPVSILASDSDLSHYEVHPGDLIRCVGYPHPNQFDGNGTGFGVVRLGCLASYPLVPTARTRTFLCDLNSFEGDSGSPVYLSEDHRSYGGQASSGRVSLILGLVAGQHFIDEEFKMIYQSGKFRHRMGLAIAFHAALIRETIDLMAAGQDGENAGF